jgi:hypothetical protein
MLFFSRVVTLSGNPRRATQWAIGMTEFVKGNYDFDVSLWAGSFGYPLGTFAWTAPVESQAALADGSAKLLANDRYYDQLEQAQDLIAQPGQDQLLDMVFGQPAEAPGIGAVVTMTTATALVDRLADAMAWGIEMAQYVTGATGVPVSLLTSVYGPLGEMSWAGVQPDFAGVDAVRGKLATDAEYLRRLTATKDLFISGSGSARQLTRIA